jgi:signal transduction histidine kinase
MADFLERAGINAHPFRACAGAVDFARFGADLAIIAEEALDESSVARWVMFLREQPKWSDFPIIVLTASEYESMVGRTARILEPLGNVTLLERPVRMNTLLSAVRSSLRARVRQYQIRDHIRQQSTAEEALRKSEKLAVAGRLAASIAHEINNPLAAITNLVYLMTTTENIEVVRAYGKIAQQELERVADIVNQTLRFHRTPTEPAPTSLATLVDTAVALFRARLRSQRVNVVTDYRTTDLVHCSEGEIRQAIINLLGNALDATNGSGGDIRIRIKSVTHPRDRRAGVSVTVADHGKGILSDDRTRLFQPFFTTKGTTGTGLGLWLTKDIIQRHEGDLWVRSRTDEPSGTVFSFWLPCFTTAKEVAERLRA